MGVEQTPGALNAQLDKLMQDPSAANVKAIAGLQFKIRVRDAAALRPDAPARAADPQAEASPSADVSPAAAPADVAPVVARADQPIQAQTITDVPGFNLLPHAPEPDAAVKPPLGAQPAPAGVDTPEKIAADLDALRARPTPLRPTRARAPSPTACLTSPRRRPQGRSGVDRGSRKSPALADIAPKDLDNALREIQRRRQRQRPGPGPQGVRATASMACRCPARQASFPRSGAVGCRGSGRKRNGRSCGRCCRRRSSG